MSEHVASKLTLFRELLGWTQEHLAEAAGLSTRTVQRAENGEEMSGETLQALAAVFDVSVAVLRQPLPSEDEIRKAAEEAQKRYKFIPLTRIERASDLQPYMRPMRGRLTTYRVYPRSRRTRSRCLRNCSATTATCGQISSRRTAVTL